MIGPMRRMDGGFNPRAHGGRDEFGFTPNETKFKEFQSTRPRGARHMAKSKFFRVGTVSIHAPTGGATYYVDGVLAHQTFQSTRPRGARRSLGAGQLFRFVSIHAPTGGATRMPASGVSKTRFQSTRPRGARPRPTPPGRAATTVSIHAPTGGATPERPAGCPHSRRFNPRAHGGRDIRSRRGCTRLEWRFNPRAHGGRDLEQVGVRDLEEVSIHAPTGGAT